MQPTPPPAPAPLPLPDLGDATVRQALAQAAQAAADVGAAAGARAVPRTAQDLAGLRQQREELSNQLVSAQGRRRDVARALERADNPANRAGLEQRLGVLDRRIAQLENDIAETGRLITTASPALIAQSERFTVLDREPPPGVIAIFFILFVLFPLVLAITRRMGRGPRVGRPDPAVREAADRLGRLEHAVEAIAIEVERVSEGQRFVTRLLSETRGAQLASTASDTADAPAARYDRPNG